MTDAKPSHWLGVAKCEPILGIKRGHILRLLARGTFPSAWKATKLRGRGGSWRVSAEEVEAYRFEHAQDHLATDITIDLDSLPTRPNYDPARASIIEAALKELTYREREIIKLRFGLNGYCYTLEEVGRLFKATRERIRQIQNKALAHLYRILKRQNLKGVADV